jgi:uncharacterized membrane protein YdjX (TVP38/TMEM64 family)
MKSYTKKIVLALLFVGVVVGVHVSGLADYITFEQLKMNRDYLLDAVEHRYYTVVGWYIAVYMIAVACFLPVATVMTIMGGFLFGTVRAVLFANIAATSGALISFLLIRYLIGSTLQTWYAHQLETFNQAMAESGVLYLVMVRLIPVIPFAVINVLAGLTRIDVRYFVLTTSVGIIPTTFIFAFAGRRLAHVTSAADLLSWQMLVAIGLIMLVAVISLFLRHWLARRPAA